MTRDDSVAHFEDALLEAFAVAADAEQAHERLRNDPRIAPFRDYVESMELRMIAVAIELVRRWGRPG